MYANLLLIHKISVSLFLLFYVVRLIGLLGGIPAISNLFTKKPVRILVDMIISTVFLISGVWMLINMPSELISTMLIIKIALVFVSIPLAIVGFKKGKKPLAALSMIILFGVYALGEMNKKRPTVNEEMVRTSVEAKELFVASNCNTCHGENGNNPMVGIGAKDLTKSKLTDAEIVNIITNGKNNMGAYKKRLTEAQIKELAAYVMSLRSAQK